MRCVNHVERRGQRHRGLTIQVILEGPKASVDEALELVVRDMEHPFERPLLVALAVDAGSADTWYEAK